MNRIGSKTYGKKLSEMSLKELWHLFPIILTGHKVPSDYTDVQGGQQKRRRHFGNYAGGISSAPLKSP